MDRVHIHQNRRRPRCQDCSHRGSAVCETVMTSSPSPTPSARKRQNQRIRTVGHTDGMVRAAIASEGVFKRGNFLTEDIAVAVSTRSTAVRIPRS